MFVPVLLFILGLVLLIKGGDWFVDGATGIAHKFHVPELLIGATIVSIGTTLPEVMVSSASALKGIGEIAYGNAIGSIICNTALISAITFAIRPCKVERKSFILPVIFFFGAAIFYCVIAYFFGEFSRVSGVILLLGFVLYMTLMIIKAKKSASNNKEELEEKKNSDVIDGSDELIIKTEKNEKKENIFKTWPFWKDIIFLVIGAGFIAFGANLLVDNGTKIATMLHVPDVVIGITFVALGTSLPELVTAITALIKGHSSLSLGNIIGANLFNLVLVSGLATVLSPFTLPQTRMISGINASLLVDIPVMFFVMAFMTLPAIKNEKLTRVQGIILLCVYTAFVVYQFLLK